MFSDISKDQVLDLRHHFCSISKYTNQKLEKRKWKWLEDTKLLNLEFAISLIRSGHFGHSIIRFFLFPNVNKSIELSLTKKFGFAFFFFFFDFLFFILFLF